MKKFIRRLLTFVVLSFLITNILLLMTASENQFINGIINKHKKLEDISEERIVFIGGSGVGHSINSELFKEETRFYPINMGLFAQFGLKYLLEETKAAIRPGDVIVILPEYHHFYYFLNGWRGFNELIYVYPKCLTHIKSYDQLNIIAKSFPGFFMNKIKFIPEKMYSKYFHSSKTNFYNDYGDYIAHLKSEEQFDIENKPLFHDFIDINTMEFQQEAIDVLNEYNTYAIQKGATVYFSYPTIPEKQYADNTQIINEVKQKLESQLNIPIINHPQSETQPIEDFYDTIYHLRSAGREKRSRRLIDQLGL